MARNALYAILVAGMIIVYTNGLRNKAQEKLEQGLSGYGPWSACDQVCGHNGKQKRTRTCTDFDEKDCVVDSQIRSCNTTNCPHPCSFDGILIQLLRVFDPTIVVNNHQIATFSEIRKVMDNRRFKKIDPDLKKDFLIKKIKDSLLVSTYRKVKYARNLFGMLLAQHKGCYYGGIAKELKNEIGNEGFKKLINADDKLTLTFVVDIGRRMKGVIGRAIAVAKEIASYDYKSDIDYVLSTFSMGTDYRSLIGDVKTYGTLAEFEKALDNLGNSEFPEEKKDADCFQPTYAGIIRGITQGYPRQGSPIYVFTNDLPRSFGEYTFENAKYHSKRNKMPVNVFVMKPYCSTKTKGRYKPIVWATGGFLWLIKGGGGKSAKKLESMVKKSLIGTSTIVRRHGKRQRKYKRASIEQSVGEFVIDDIAQGGTIEIEAKSDNKGIKLLNPNDNQKPHEIDNDDHRIWTVLRPTKGRWRFDPEDVEDFKVLSHTGLDITFGAIVLREKTHGGEEVVLDHPLIGEKARLKIVIPNLSRLNSSTLSFPGLKYLDTEADDSFIYESVKVLGRNTFNITMTGETLSGYRFTREVDIQPRIAAIMSDMKLWIDLDAGKEFMYNASIVYTGSKPKTFRVEVRTNSEDKDSGKDHGDGGDQDDKVLEKGVNSQISKRLTAPTSGKFTVKITIKDTEDRDDGIFFEDGPFSVA